MAKNNIFIILILAAIFALTAVRAFAAPRQNQPLTITQPTGEKIHVFVSGDEFYHRIHDKDGYTIVQDPKDGWFYYAALRKGDLVPARYKAGAKDPKKTSLKPNVAPPAKKMRELYNLYRTPVETKFLNGETVRKAPASNTVKAQLRRMNNVVILIRFNDDSNFPVASLQKYDTICNGSINSLKHYYDEVSYGNLNIRSYFYPWYAGVDESSYQDSHERGYYRPYNASTNPDGYKNYSENYTRCQTLLSNALQWVSSNTPIPDSIDLDSDGDGYVDNVSFIIRGDSDNWMELLWAHRGSLTTTVKFHNKRISTYIFMPENQTDRSILCHEFFHALGAPDLYHYNDGLDLTPVGAWDLMESGKGHMSSYMKKRYANWIDMDTIKKSGIYSVKPLMNDRTGVAKLAVIPNGIVKQSLIMEYRKKSGLYESDLPGSGLIVYRVNPSYTTNADYNGTTELDMLYVFRPYGAVKQDGIITDAFFSQEAGRTFVNDLSEPVRLFKSRGEVTGMGIYNINVTADSAAFYFHFGNNFEPSNISAFYNFATEKIDVSWNKNSSGTGASVLAVSDDNTFQYLDPDVVYSAGDVLPSGAAVVYQGDAEQFSYTPTTRGKALYFTVFSVQNSGYSLGITSQAYSPAITVDCGVLANMDTASATAVAQRDTAAQWGYLAGHSGMNNTVFTEYFNNDEIFLVKGLTINVAKSVAVNENSTVEFWIADVGDDLAVTNKGASDISGRVLYKEAVAMRTLSEGVNNIVFETPVMIRKDFLAGFTIAYNGDTFALKVESARDYQNYSMAIFPDVCNGIEGQAGFFILSPDTASIPAEENSATQVNVWIDGRDWDVSDVPDWLDVVSDKTDGILNISAKSANLHRTRSARITLSASNGETRTLAVGQRGLGDTVLVANENIALKSNIHLYPNPSANGVFSLDAPLPTLITVFDMNGKTLMRGVAAKGVSTIDLSADPSGVYFVRLQENGIDKILKMIKK
jgi:M6 family metalloprotease-like protein